MTGVLAIDPGYAGDGNACAWTWRGDLHDVWFERYGREPGDSRATMADERAINAVVIERPQQDARSYGVPPEVLIKLAWESALLAGAYAAINGAPLVELTPSEWKGSEPKPQMHARLWAELLPVERELLGGERTGNTIFAAREKGARDRWGKPGVAYYPRAFKTHNLLDAVALAFVHGGRLEKRG
jgi:hypothetical protein